MFKSDYYKMSYLAKL